MVGSGAVDIRGRSGGSGAPVQIFSEGRGDLNAAGFSPPSQFQPAISRQPGPVLGAELGEQ